MRNLIKWVILGPIVGFGFTILVYILGGGVEILNCGLSLIRCNFGFDKALPTLWSMKTLKNIIKYAMFGGCIFGGIYGYSLDNKEKEQKEKEQKEQEEKEQRRQYANELKTDLQFKLESAYAIQNKINQYEISSNFVSDTKIFDGWAILNEIENNNEELKKIIKEITEGKEEL